MRCFLTYGVFTAVVNGLFRHPFSFDHANAQPAFGGDVGTNVGFTPFLRVTLLKTLFSYFFAIIPFYSVVTLIFFIFIKTEKHFSSVLNIAIHFL